MKLAVDWDDTLVRGVWPGRNGEWLNGAVFALTELLESGDDITIYTCRTLPVLPDMRRRPDTAVEREYETIRRRLDVAGLDKVRINRLPGKPPADVYVDDKGLRFTNWSNALAQLRELRSFARTRT